MNEYTVREQDDGTVDLIGMFPLDLLDRLLKFYRRQGFETVDLKLTEARRTTMTLTREKQPKKPKKT
jgi:hypothetical protein